MGVKQRPDEEKRNELPPSVRLRGKRERRMGSGDLEMAGGQTSKQTETDGKRGNSEKGCE